MRYAIRDVASPNHEPRHDGRAPDMLILHYTGMVGAECAVRWLCMPESRVSCHYLVDSDGAVVRMVEEGLRAWHAGVSHWQGESDLNSCSIGVEIHNPGHDHGYPDFPDAQMHVVEALCRDILGRHAIPPERVLAHSDVAPARKIDPGERFDWRRLAGAGIGHWVPPAPIAGDAGFGPGDQSEDVRRLQRRLARYGYGIAETGRYDRATEQVVVAVQRHWRQEKVDGRADRSTVQTLERLQAGLGRDGP